MLKKRASSVKPKNLRNVTRFIESLFNSRIIELVSFFLVKIIKEYLQRFVVKSKPLSQCEYLFMAACSW